MSEIIIVDNGSTDGTAEFLKEFEKKHNYVRVIYNKNNLGFAAGCNQGIKAAKGEIIGLFNNDILLHDGWFEPIMEIFDKEKKAGFVSANSIEACEFPIRYFKRAVKDNIAVLDEPYTSTVLPSFSCVFAKKTLFNDIGLFDEKFYPAYFEDNDIAWRAVLAGYKNFVSNRSFFYHKGSLTGKSLDKYNEIFGKNRKYFYEKYSDKYFVACYTELQHKCSFLALCKIRRLNKSILFKIARFLKIKQCKKV